MLNNKMLKTLSAGLLMVFALATLSTGVTKPASASQSDVRYIGFYACTQGLTGVTLVVNQKNPSVVRFEFYPLLANNTVPVGAFLLRGQFPLQGGAMRLDPVRWISQPIGYVMIGMEGISRDGGSTFEGRITGGFDCTGFSVRRESR